MTNTLTIDQLQELLQIQKEFDDRIPTLNLQDSKVAYVVEFFEWFNTLETFKNWKKKPGKPLDVQLDELADMLAFGLSIANQQSDDMEEILDYVEDGIFTDCIDSVEIDFNDSDIVDEFMSDIDELYNGWFSINLFLPFAIAIQYYTIDKLISAYKRKWSEIMQDKMEQQTQKKVTCKDILDRVKEVLGSDTIFSHNIQRFNRT
ncbi:dUTPase [Staphylococcus aureus]|uniref:dUTPase n=2 Tax=Staphylococcus aureus TaxID=1280 RepID=UPI0039BF7D4F